MIRTKLSEIIQVVNGQAFNCKTDKFIAGIASKVCRVRKGFLYVPLVGSTPVSAKLIDLAYKKGAVAAVLPKKVNSRLPQVIVKDNNRASYSIFKYCRSKIKIPIIAVTGSAGKTTTKDMLALMLGRKYRVCKTASNDNFYLGTKRTLLGINSSHNAAVFEVGFGGRFGDIKALADLIRPKIAVITNISTGHCGIVGSKENIMKAKMELTNYFDKNNILIINNDDETLCTIKDKPYKIIRVSMQGKGDYNAYDIVNNGEKGIEFKCNLKDSAHLFKLTVPGVHFVYSALVCIAIGELYNVNVEQIKIAVKNFSPTKLRMNILKTKNNIIIINDCYNANLASMKSGIDVLKSISGSKKIAVLGDIREQGKYSEEIHREVGKYVKDKCDLLIAIGKDSRFIFEETKDSVPSKFFETKKEACQYLSTIAKPNDVILLKGSRGIQLEQVANYLMYTMKGR